MGVFTFLCIILVGAFVPALYEQKQENKIQIQREKDAEILQRAEFEAAKGGADHQAALDERIMESEKILREKKELIKEENLWEEIDTETHIRGKKFGGRCSCRCFIPPPNKEGVIIDRDGLPGWCFFLVRLDSVL